MGTAVETSDANGNFHFDVFASNRMLVEKSASIWAFTTGRAVEFESSTISASLFGRARSIRIVLSPRSGERGNVVWKRAPLDKLPAGENEYSMDLASMVGLITNGASTCNHAGLPVAERAMSEALRIARTFDERLKVRAACKYAAISVHKRWTNDRWPFDCNHLPFEQMPSPQVLAVEAQLEAERKAAVENSSAVKRSSSLAESPK
jgi:hypothetical protein